jgi:phosphotransferase system enzyme I (PtsI)
MKILKGFSASGGIAQGTVCVYSREAYENIPHYEISEKQISNELKRIVDAFETANKSLDSMLEVSQDFFGKQGRDIVSAHLAILNDKAVRRKIENLIKNNKINAEHAVEDVFDSYIARLAKSGLHFEEISHDIKDVKDRVLESFGLGEGKFTCPIGEKGAVIVAVEHLTPSIVLSIPKENFLAFITRKGGYTAHATILARAINVPVIFGIDVEKELKCQTKIIVDGTLGKVFVDPDSKTQNAYKRKKELIEERMKVCRIERRKPARTAEGKRITLKVNISTIGELELLKEQGVFETPIDDEIHYDGIGLLRTEFIFMKDYAPPTEEEQFGIYKMIIESAGQKPVVMRLLDLSRDKLPKYIHISSGTEVDVRGARAVTLFKEIYMIQARAMLRAAVFGNLKILFPMIADIDDINIYKELIAEAEELLKKDNFNYKTPALGIMFETPSSIILADTLINEVDFSNIGTNDLLQYSVAASRDAQERYHMMHPSIIKMIKVVVEAGKEHDIETCLCGEIGSFENYYPVLLDIGVRSFSVPAAKYEDIKCELLHISGSNYKDAAAKYLRNKTLESQEKFFTSIR